MLPLVKILVKSSVCVFNRLAFQTSYKFAIDIDEWTCLTTDHKTPFNQSDRSEFLYLKSTSCGMRLSALAPSTGKAYVESEKRVDEFRFINILWIKRLDNTRSFADWSLLSIKFRFIGEICHNLFRRCVVLCPESLSILSFCWFPSLFDLYYFLFR